MSQSETESEEDLTTLQNKRRKNGERGQVFLQKETQIKMETENIQMFKSSHHSFSDVKTKPEEIPEVYTAIVVQFNAPVRRYNMRNRKKDPPAWIKHEEEEYDSDEGDFIVGDDSSQENNIQGEDYHSESTSEEQCENVVVAEEISSNIKNGKKRKRVALKRVRKSAIPWTKAESKTLAQLVSIYGAKEWQSISQILQAKHNNNRTAAQCSQRWCRVINPVINKGPWSEEEDIKLLQKYEELHGSWCKIVKYFPDRTDTQCKRRYEKISTFH